MKRQSIALNIAINALLFVILLSSCSKQNSSNSVNSYSPYTGQDLNVGECVLDSFYDMKSSLGPNFVPYNKVNYLNKREISTVYYQLFSLFQLVSADTFNYQNSILQSVNSQILSSSPLYYSSKFEYLNSNISRIYIYDDNYPIPYYRQNGLYFQYNNNNLVTTRTLKYPDINSNYQIRNIVFNYKYYSDNNIDSVIGDGFFKLTYGTDINKLQGMANFSSFIYRPETETIQFVSGLHILNFTLGYNVGYLDGVFLEVLLKSSKYPTSITFINYYGNITTLYIKYQLNSSGYATNIYMANTPNFNLLQNEVLRLTYLCK